MNIVVCVKRVPDTETKIKVGGDGKTIDPTGVEFVINPFDEFAVREIAYYQVKGNEEEPLMTLMPELSDGVPSVIRVSLIDQGAHSAFLRLHEMPEAASRFINNEIPSFVKMCEAGGRKLILTTDHGLSLTRGGLCHGKGGVFENIIFRAEWPL